jgi:hypothetical protein
MSEKLIEKLKQTHHSIHQIYNSHLTNDQGTPSLLLIIVVKHYTIKGNAAILDDVDTWFKEHECVVRPLIITVQESELLHNFCDNLAELPTPEDILSSYKKHENYPANTRRHLIAAFEEIQRLLRGLEQDFPTSGLYALSVGQNIELLFQRLMRWGGMLFQQENATDAEMWEYLRKQWPKDRELSRPGAEHFPIRLSAFIHRHELLSSFFPQSYGDNDLEVEQLTTPLLHLARLLKSETQRRLTTPEEKHKRKRNIWLTTAIVVAVISVAIIALYWFLRPPTLVAVSLPKDAKPGGIAGRYYKGPNFNQFIGERLDQNINMYWSRSPMKNVPEDHFSVSWKGYILAPAKGKYRFCLKHDDGGRLSIGSYTLVNDWRGGSARTHCKEISLASGWHSFEVRMYESTGPAVIELSWEHPQRRGMHPVPSANLCCKP